MPADRQDPYLFSAASREVRAADAARAATPRSPRPAPSTRPTTESKPRPSAGDAGGFLRLVDETAAGAPADPINRADHHSDATARGFGAVAREAAMRENVRSAGAASQLSSDDARVIFAMKVQDCLEGGRAAILRPKRREELLSLSHQMGFRPFDANLIIALVQDAARRGEVLAALQPHQAGGPPGATEPAHVRELIRSDEARAGLELMPSPSRGGRYRVHTPPDTSVRDRVILAVVLALFMLASMIALMGA